MIGNTVQFSKFDIEDYMAASKAGQKYVSPTLTGLVVDAYTKVTGKVKGDSVLGFGDVNGDIKSDRTYKIMCYESWDDKKKFPKFHEVDHQRISVVSQFQIWLLVDFMAFSYRT